MFNRPAPYPEARGEKAADLQACAQNSRDAFLC
jgi:hypothetical protein